MPITFYTTEDRALLHAIARKLDLDIQLDAANLALEYQNMATLSDLTATAEKTNGTIDSAVVVINGIAARLEAASHEMTPEDKAKLDVIIAGLNGRADALAFAIDADAHGPAPVVPTGVPN